jgi:hypothetical protein
MEPAPANISDNVNLKEYILRIIEERDKLYTERFAAQEKAVLKQEVASEKRFEGINEFRTNLKDQQITFIPRLEYDTKFQGIEKLIDAQAKALGLIQIGMRDYMPISSGDKRHEELQLQINDLRLLQSNSAGAVRGANALWGYGVGAVGFVIGVMMLILRMMGK